MQTFIERLTLVLRDRHAGSIATSSAKMPPVSGLAASFSALTFCRSDVM